MKKIRNISQLKYEQEKLRNRQLELEKEMHESWRKIRKSARIQNLAKEVFSEWVLNKMVNRGIGRLLRLFN